MSNDRLIKDYSRRDFLKITGASLVAAALGSFIPSCATIDLEKDWSKVSVKDFDMEGFDGWYVRNKLYNGLNPNLIWRHSGGHFPTFKASVYSVMLATPGIDHSVHSGEEMVAVASGEVENVIDLADYDTGRALGMVVKVEHGRDGLHSEYAHLGEVYVKSGQKIKRGDPIGNVPSKYTQIAKLMFSMPLRQRRNWVDPDNYGKNHSYRDYWDGSTDLEITNSYEKLLKQKDIVMNFQGSCHEKFRGGIDDDLYFKKHRGEDQVDTCFWSDVEKFRYLKTLYKINPELFPSISRDHYKAIKNEFYANQPIILTFPLKKS